MTGATLCDMNEPHRRRRNDRVAVAASFLLLLLVTLVSTRAAESLRRIQGENKTMVEDQLHSSFRIVSQSVFLRR